VVYFKFYLEKEKWIDIVDDDETDSNISEGSKQF